MSPKCLHSLAGWSSILTFVVTVIGAAVGVFEYVKYLRGLAGGPLDSSTRDVEEQRSVKAPAS
jgi:hypothetical protein